LPVGQFWVQLPHFWPQMTALTESAIARRTFIYATDKVIVIHWRRGWDHLAWGELCQFGFAQDGAIAPAVELKFASQPERVGFAQILFDLRASFASLNRVIKDYQRVFGT
jgi:hypothetical protein